MSSLSRAVPMMPPTPKVLMNAMTASGWNPVLQTPALQFPTKQIQMANTTANTLTDVFNITGAGMLKFTSVYLIGGPTSVTLRVVLTLDGIVVFDSTSAAFNAQTQFQGMTLIGGYESTSNQAYASYSLDRVPFSKSAHLQISTSGAATPWAQVMYETY